VLSAVTIVDSSARVTDLDDARLAARGEEPDAEGPSLSSQ
jgi:hypothetical protein